jgi:hypothetical protein
VGLDCGFGLVGVVDSVSLLNSRTLGCRPVGFFRYEWNRGGGPFSSKKNAFGQVEKADLIGYAKKLKYAVCKIAPFLFAL